MSRTTALTAHQALDDSPDSELGYEPDSRRRRRAGLGNAVPERGRPHPRHLPICPTRDYDLIDPMKRLLQG